ncbi:hypothetical protein QIA00_05100 (plasmid) [Borreliella americana]|uniref:Uncharacterized protein n=1 Tax=Borreliella americana TaxID=478807 RepID=A0ACD5G690_9SPIR
MKLRLQEIEGVIKDLLSLKIFNPSSDVKKAKSDLVNIEQTLQDLTNDVLRTTLSNISTIITKVKNFNFSNFLKKITDSIKMV